MRRDGVSSGTVWRGKARCGFSSQLSNAGATNTMTTATGRKRNGATNRLTELGGDVPTDGGAVTIAESVPYAAHVTLLGSADLILHRWNVESVNEKAAAAKGSKAKKTDDVESYVYRNENGYIALPSEYLRQSLIHAAKFRQDPRSPRKSAMDLFKAALLVDPPLASLGVKEWDYLDTRRVVIQRNGINRTRPALRAGWRVQFTVTVLLPEYVNSATLLEVMNAAGRLIGVGDFRPTYGRFQVAEFKAQPV